jgi:hypothetical protein
MVICPSEVAVPLVVNLTVPLVGNPTAIPVGVPVFVYSNNESIVAALVKEDPPLPTLKTTRLPLVKLFETTVTVMVAATVPQEFVTV